MLRRANARLEARLFGAYHDRKDHFSKLIILDGPFPVRSQDLGGPTRALCMVRQPARGKPQAPPRPPTPLTLRAPVRPPPPQPTLWALETESSNTRRLSLRTWSSSAPAALAP